MTLDEENARLKQQLAVSDEVRIITANRFVATIKLIQQQLDESNAKVKELTSWHDLDMQQIAYLIDERDALLWKLADRDRVAAKDVQDN